MVMTTSGSKLTFDAFYQGVSTESCHPLITKVTMDRSCQFTEAVRATSESDRDG